MTLSLAMVATGCTHQAGAESCTRQIEELRAEVRALEAQVHPHALPAGGAREDASSLKAVEERLESTFKEDTQDGKKRDEAWARVVKEKFKGLLPPDAIVQCGPSLCRLETSFENQNAASDFVRRALVGRSAVWLGRFAIAKVPSVGNPPASNLPIHNPPASHPSATNSPVTNPSASNPRTNPSDSPFVLFLFGRETGNAVRPPPPPLDECGCRNHETMSPGPSSLPMPSGSAAGPALTIPRRNP